MSTQAPPINVILVAYGRGDLVERALGGITGRECSIPIVVVDNSSDSSIAAIAHRYGSTYVDTGANLGFARAVNLGLNYVDPSSDVLLLNPDAIVDYRTVELLQRRLRQSSVIACTAPAQVDDEGTAQRVEWPFPSPMRAWLDVLRLGSRLGGPTFLIGSVLLLRREAICDVGLFDERYFLYAEEVDWQRRAAELGWTTQLCDDLLASHLGAATSSDSRQRERYFAVAHERYIRKWYGSLGWQSYRTAEFVNATLRIFLGSSMGRRAAARKAATFAVGPLRTHRLHSSTTSVAAETSDGL